jgi:hypothetical protein
VEQPRRRRLLFVVAVAALAGTAAIVALRPRAADPSQSGARGVPGEGPAGRVVVEVLNGSGRVGLARAATRRLRDAGLDVVYFGTDETDALDSTVVLLRRGDPAAADRVAAALGVGVIRPAPDPGRLVDVTVRLGTDFAAAAAPLMRQP